MNPQTLNIIIGVVLACAAIFAFLIQRARYLREIEPDLELSWPDNIRIGQLNDTLKKFWCFYIDVHVKNKSKNHAYDLNCEIELDLFPVRGLARCITAKLPQQPRLHAPNLLAERNDIIEAYCGLNYAQGLYEQLNDWPIENAGFQATVIVKYSSRRELLLFILTPWKNGIETYERRISGSWGVSARKTKTKKYICKPWKFPEISLRNINTDEVNIHTDK